MAGTEHGLKDFNAWETVNASARTGEGLDKFSEALEDILMAGKTYIEKVFSFNEAGKIQLIRKNGQLLSEEYREDGIYVTAYVPRELAGKLNA